MSKETAEPVTDPRERTADHLLDHAYDVVRRLEEFGSYQHSRSRAIGALKRRARGYSGKEYADAFSRAGVLFREAALFVDENVATLFEWYRTEDEELWNPLRNRLEGRCPGFGSDLYSYALWWRFFWHHLK